MATLNATCHTAPTHTFALNAWYVTTITFLLLLLLLSIGFQVYFHRQGKPSLKTLAAFAGAFAADGWVFCPMLRNFHLFRQLSPLRVCGAESLCATSDFPRSYEFNGWIGFGGFFYTVVVAGSQVLSLLHDLSNPNLKWWKVGLRSLAVFFTALVFYPLVAPLTTIPFDDKCLFSAKLTDIMDVSRYHSIATIVMLSLEGLCFLMFVRVSFRKHAVIAMYTVVGMWMLVGIGLSLMLLIKRHEEMVSSTHWNVWAVLGPSAVETGGAVVSNVVTGLLGALTLSGATPNPTERPHEPYEPNITIIDKVRAVINIVQCVFAFTGLVQGATYVGLAGFEQGGVLVLRALLITTTSLHFLFTVFVLLATKRSWRPNNVLRRLEIINSVVGGLAALTFCIALVIDEVGGEFRCAMRWDSFCGNVASAMILFMASTTLHVVGAVLIRVFKEEERTRVEGVERAQIERRAERQQLQYPASREAPAETPSPQRPQYPYPTPPQPRGPQEEDPYPSNPWLQPQNGGL